MTTPPALDEVSWASYLALKWLDPLVNRGYERQVNLQDSPPLGDQEDTARNTRRYVHLLEEEERSGKRNPLITAIFWAFWPQLLLLQIMKISQYLLGLLSPFILQRVLIFQEAQADKNVLSSSAAQHGFTAVGALICLGIFNLFYNTHVDLWKARLTIRIESSLKGALLYRGVQGLTQTPGDISEEGTTHGESAIYNVISFDVGDSVNMVWVLLDIWSLPIQLVAAFTALFSQVAWSVIPGLVTILLCKSFNLIMGYADGVYRDRLYFAKDERLGRCSEGFTNIRTLRMLAWTPAYEQVIASARREELRMAWIRLWLQKMPQALDYGLTTLVTLVTLGFYVVTTHEQLKASLALPVIALIGSLIGPIGQFPTLVNQYKVFRSAYDRFHRFMGFGHRSKPFAPDLDSPRGGPESALVLEDCTFQWAAQEPLLAQGPFFQLQGIDLQVEAGSTTAIISQEGQGKSSLLLAILGEMAMKSGHFSGSNAPGGGRAPAVPETAMTARELLLEACSLGGRKIALAPQEPWLFAGTLRSNILFGLDMNNSIYERVLEACALKLDLQSMPLGDLTEIAAGGSTISGGQRARVGIARAAYRAALEQEARHVPLVVLDDPFCALDKEVAVQVCKSLLSQSGLLRQSTVLVAAADPWWLSCLVENGQLDAGIVILRSGSVLTRGSLSELLGQDLPELKTVVMTQASQAEGTEVFMRNPQDEEDEGEMPERQAEDAAPRLPPLPMMMSPPKSIEAETQTPLTKEQEIKGALASEEGRVAGHVQWSTYYSYLQAVGYFNFTVMFIALAGIMVFQNFCNLWIVYWTSDDKETTLMYGWMKGIGAKPTTGTTSMLTVYGVLIACFFISNFAGHALEIIGGIRAAKRIFANALDGALYKPFQWWDTNPTGRVLNRFSADVEVMDKAVTNIFGIIIGAVLYFLGHTLVLTFSSPMSIILLPLIILLMEYFARYYRNTIREIQRLYLVSQSEVYQEMTDAITGGVTIRAYSAKEQVLMRCLLDLEEFQRAGFVKTTLSQWIGLRMGLVGFILSTFNQLQPVLQYYGVIATRSAALVGFSINYSNEVSSVVQQFVMNFSEMEMQLVSIERLCEYVRRRSTMDADASIALPSAASVQQGLELRNVVVRYRPSLPPALDGVTLRFMPGDTVAVVGRTGAGKTSLMLAILQLAPYSGEIYIDEQPLTNLNEQACGRLVAVVPQQPVLFSGTLRWNLDPANQFSDQRLWDSIKAVGLLRSCKSALGLSAQVQGSIGGSQPHPGVLALSQGQRQLLCAARALLRQPRVALLDEVTAALPQEVASSTVAELVKKFKEINATTLMVTHQEELTSVCDRTICLSQGRVVSDTAGGRRSMVSM